MKETLICPDCKSRFVYTKVDGTMVCRKCGHQIKLIKRKENEEDKS